MVADNLLFKGWKTLDGIIGDNWTDGVPKKLKGMLGIELVRECVARHLAAVAPDLEVSAPNSFIFGSNFEYDLLIVRRERKASSCFEDAGGLVSDVFWGLIYQPEDVVAVVEVKWSGLHSLEADTDKIVAAVLAAQNVCPLIRPGYISFTEAVPVRKFLRSGVPTKNLPEETIALFNKKLRGGIGVYFVSTHTGMQFDVSDFSEFNQFCDYLIGREN